VNVLTDERNSFREGRSLIDRVFAMTQPIEERTRVQTSENVEYIETNCGTFWKLEA
jgi:hypothetical protein